MATRAATGGARASAIGRISDHEGFLRHRRYYWAKAATLVSVLAIAIYALVDVSPRPNGGTAVGYLLGTIGLLLILWLTTLGLRKRAITPGPWSLKAWTSAHVYLGLSLIVIGTLHTGFQFGWNVHTLAYALMMIVIGSGLYGIFAYSGLPRALSDNRAELTQRQMLDGIASLDRQLREAALPLPADQAELVKWSIDNTRLGGSAGERLSGKSPKCGNARAMVQLRSAAGIARGDNADQLRRIIGLMERKDQALALARRHIQIRSRLEIWLFIHVPTTFGLIAALTAHVISVFYYW